jgi:hypothetical protein
MPKMGLYTTRRRFDSVKQKFLEEKSQLFCEIEFLGDSTPGTVTFSQLTDFGDCSPDDMKRYQKKLLNYLTQPTSEMLHEPTLCDGKTIILGHSSRRHQPWTVFSVIQSARSVSICIFEWIEKPSAEYFEAERKFHESRPKDDPDLGRRMREAQAYQRKVVEEIARTGVPSEDPFLPTVKQAREMMVLRAKREGTEPPVYPELPESSQPVDNSGPRRIVRERRDRRRPQKLE